MAETNVNLCNVKIKVEIEEIKQEIQEDRFLPVSVIIVIIIIALSKQIIEEIIY